MEFFPIEPIRPGFPAHVERIERDHQRERARDDEGSPSDDADEQAFEEEFSEVYEQSRMEDHSAATPDAYLKRAPQQPVSDWDPRRQRDRRTSREHDEDDREGHEPGPHIDIIA